MAGDWFWHLSVQLHCTQLDESVWNCHSTADASSLFSPPTFTDQLKRMWTSRSGVWVSESQTERLACDNRLWDYPPISDKYKINTHPAVIGTQSVNMIPNLCSWGVLKLVSHRLTDNCQNSVLMVWIYSSEGISVRGEVKELAAILYQLLSWARPWILLM